MAPTRTRTVKNKHAANKSGISNSKSARAPSGGPVVRQRKSKSGGKPAAASQVRPQTAAALFKKRKARVYTDAELGIPKLNMITPVGVTKPKGKKKGKVFIDDKVRTPHVPGDKKLPSPNVPAIG